MYNGKKVGNNDPEETTQVEQGIWQHKEVVRFNGQNKGEGGEVGIWKRLGVFSITLGDENRHLPVVTNSQLDY